MHTTFRVYGSAIGRTALGCRTVGRGFKSVSRMKGGVLPYDRPAYVYNTRSEYEPSVSYTDDTWNTERDEGDYFNEPSRALFNEMQQARDTMIAPGRRTDEQRLKEVQVVNDLNDRMHGLKNARKENINFIEDTPEEIQARNEAAAKRENKIGETPKELRSAQLKKLTDDMTVLENKILENGGVRDKKNKEFKKQLKELKKQYTKLKNEDKKLTKQENKPVKVVAENGEVHKDEGFQKNDTIAVMEEIVSTYVFDDKLIYKEHKYEGEQLGAWNPVKDDFCELEEIKETTTQKLKREQQQKIIQEKDKLNQEFCSAYLNARPELKKQQQNALYIPEKDENGNELRDENKNLIPSSRIKEAKTWEIRMCGPANMEATEVFSSVLHEGRQTNFKTSDEIAVTHNILGGNSLPVDLIDIENENASESKYYTKVEYIRMYNITMKEQKKYYEKQKELLKRCMKKILLNPKDEEAIFNRDQQLEILNSKQSFLRSFYANNNYMSVNIGAGKWGNVPDNVTEEIQGGLANTTKQINIYKEHASPKIQLSFNEHRRMIRWNVKDDNKSKKRSKQQLTDELSNAFFKNANGKSINYGYTINVKFKDGSGLYNYTKDDYLNDCKHIVQGYKIGASYDQHGNKGLFMDAIKIPIEKFIPFGLKFRKKSEIIVLDSESDED